MRHASWVCFRMSTRTSAGIAKDGPHRDSKRSRILSGVLLALAAMGIAGVVLTGCDRTISDNGSVLAESVR